MGIKKFLQSSEEFRVMVPAAIISALGIILYQKDRNLFFICVISMVVLFLFLLGIKSKKQNQKILNFSIAFFSLLHLLVFPLLYSSLLKKDPTSIIINNEIFQNEKMNALNEIDQKYKPLDISQKLKVVNYFLDNYSNILDQEINYLENNILITDSILLIKVDSINKENHDPGRYSKEIEFKAYDVSGHFVVSINEKPLAKLYKKKITFLDFFKRCREYYSTNALEYSDEKRKVVEQNRIWSFIRIIPYSINIFNTDSIKPISRSANLIFSLHYYSVWFIILTVIITTFLNMLLNKRND